MFNVGDRVKIKKQALPLTFKKSDDDFSYAGRVPKEGTVFFIPPHKRWVGIDFGIYKASFFVEDVELKEGSNG